MSGQSNKVVPVKVQRPLVHSVKHYWLASEITEHTKNHQRKVQKSIPDPLPKFTLDDDSFLKMANQEGSDFYVIYTMIFLAIEGTFR